MSNQTFGLQESVYQYLLSVSLQETEVQKYLREVTHKLPEHEMQIAPEQGQFMRLLVSLINAQRVVEVGTFTGYSALSMALALPDNGRIICCDISQEWTDIAHKYWLAAGVADKIELRLGDAIDTLTHLLATHTGQIDLMFIDADKENYHKYFELGLTLLRPGGLILVDNVLWNGTVADQSNQEPTTQAIRAFNERVFQDDRVELSMLPLADGLTMARKIE